MLNNSQRGRIARSFVGTATEPFSVEIERGAIASFVAAVGDTNPIHQDEACAKSWGYRGLIAPPTFPVTFQPKERPAWLVELDFARLLAGEHAFSYQRPIFDGDVLSCRLHLVSVEDKIGRSGPFQKAVQELACHDAAGSLVVVHKRVVLYRLLLEFADE